MMNQIFHFGYKGQYVVQISWDQGAGERGGEVSQKLTFAHRGGEVWRGAKSAHAMLELPII